MRGTDCFITWEEFQSSGALRTLLQLMIEEWKTRNIPMVDVALEN